MAAHVEIVPVGADNVAKLGFFCRKSKMKTEGNRRKLEWATKGFEAGLGIDVLYEEGRSVGFIEYADGEHAWRAVYAPGYLVIHCLWVVGRGKGKGHGTALLRRAEAAARDRAMAGVAMVTTPGVWLADNQLLLRHGYEPVDQAPPAFQLMVKRFGDAPMPGFPTDWDDRAAAFGAGLTVVTTGQCPYLDDAEQEIIDAAQEGGLAARIATLTSAEEVQRRSPSAYGVFGVVLDGRLLSYHYLLGKDFAALVADRS